MVKERKGERERSCDVRCGSEAEKQEGFFTIQAAEKGMKKDKERGARSTAREQNR